MWSLVLTSLLALAPRLEAAIETSIASGAASEVAKPKAVKTGIEFAVTPGSVSIFVDGAKVGTAASTSFVATKPGLHTVKLTRGADETELQLNVKKGEVVQFAYEF
ncbi:MAG: hypothetical protein ACFB9M_02990 [Myxococcota bacterium]